MRMRFMLLMFVVLMLSALALPAFALTEATGEYLNVSNLEPFSAEAQFMSLPGYLRWETWKSQGIWLTYAETARIVASQKG